jgi:hypothetical protein
MPHNNRANDNLFANLAPGEINALIKFFLAANGA